MNEADNSTARALAQQYLDAISREIGHSDWAMMKDEMGEHAAMRAAATALIEAGGLEGLPPSPEMETAEKVVAAHYVGLGQLHQAYLWRAGRYRNSEAARLAAEAADEAIYERHGDE